MTVRYRFPGGEWLTIPYDPARVAGLALGGAEIRIIA